ncbi:hypothetical protein [Haladaptatus salinisoli]|uniref:hypothetical protein n=1 Tax=Haladaptatus salinisoli TaxID=2884876 RepID=UPI001D0AD798|nr:hypothetical protein [Haladaptatus salinisoli]
MAAFDALVRKRDARVAWALVAVVTASIPAMVAFGALLWAGFATLLVAVAVVPPLAARDSSVMLPWETLLFALSPIFVRAFGPPALDGVALSLAVSSIALVLVVELATFTSARLAPWFAVTLVALTTMAAVGAWAVVQFYAGRLLGTQYLGSQNALMWDFVAATGVGAGVGIASQLYFDLSAVDTDIDLLGGGDR